MNSAGCVKDIELYRPAAGTLALLLLGIIQADCFTIEIRTDTQTVSKLLHIDSPINSKITRSPKCMCVYGDALNNADDSVFCKLMMVCGRFSVTA